MNFEPLEINGVIFHLKIIEEERNNVKASIKDNIVIIQLPSFLDREEKFRRILKMRKWAKRRIEKKPEQFKPKEQKTYKHGDIIKVGAEEFSVHIECREKQSSSARITGNSIYFVISSQLSEEKKQEHISSLLSRCVASRRLPLLKQKIEYVFPSRSMTGGVKFL
ncbi:DUF45 domain-containing protein [Candidatus Woesearchaeota archaeon]|nr:DUF45 domain-containing protein [Candidatus Woesearchaeota archaeon]